MDKKVLDCLSLLLTKRVYAEVKISCVRQASDQAREGFAPGETSRQASSEKTVLHGVGANLLSDGRQAALSCQA